MHISHCNRTCAVVRVRMRVPRDVPMERIMLRVGNEKGEQALRTVSLRTYLAELRSFLHRPDGWAGTNSSLYDETRDSHVIVSAQACFLPVPQVPTSCSAVVVVLCTNPSTRACVFLVACATCRAARPSSTSTSTTTRVGRATQPCWRSSPPRRAPRLRSSTPWVSLSPLLVPSPLWLHSSHPHGAITGQHLYFNKNGERASFIGQRLSDNRQERGVVEVTLP